MEPEVDVSLTCMGISGIVAHDSNDDLLYCDARSDDGDMLVATGKDLNELIDSFRDCVVGYFEFVKDKKGYGD